MVFIIINLVGLIIGLTYLFFIFQNSFGGKIKENYSGTIFNGLIVIVIIAIISPILIALNEFTFEDFKNEINTHLGDTLGGFTAPLVGLCNIYLIYFIHKRQVQSENDNRKIELIKIVKDDIEWLRQDKYNIRQLHEEFIQRLIENKHQTLDYPLYSYENAGLTKLIYIIRHIRNNNDFIVKHKLISHYQVELRNIFFSFYYPHLNNIYNNLTARSNNHFKKFENVKLLISLYEDILVELLGMGKKIIKETNDINSMKFINLGFHQLHQVSDQISRAICLFEKLEDYNNINNKNDFISYFKVLKKNIKKRNLIIRDQDEINIIFNVFLLFLLNIKRPYWNENIKYNTLFEEFVLEKFNINLNSNKVQIVSDFMNIQRSTTKIDLYYSIKFMANCIKNVNLNLDDKTICEISKQLEPIFKRIIKSNFDTY